MKNALVIVIVTGCFYSINAYPDELTCESLTEFYKLWADSWFGKDPTREIATWMIQNPKGNLDWIRWPASRKWKKETWKGIIPANLVAQVHTHPLNTDPRPSYKDVVFSRNLKTELYTISRNGIWKVIPNGTITKVAGANWHLKLQKAICPEPVQLAIDNGGPQLAFPKQSTKLTDFAWHRLHPDD